MRLEEAITLYVQRMQAKGMLFAKGHQTYRAFLRTAGNLQLSQVSGHHVSEFLSAPISSTWAFRRKHSLLRHFFSYWAAHGMMTELDMPANRPAERSRFVSYVYSREELRRLLRNLPLIQSPNDEVHFKTVRAVLLTLYATGATVGEVLRLTREDVDLENSSIHFSGSLLKADRSVPIGRDLVRVARQHWERRKRVEGQSGFFFSKIDGMKITPHRLGAYFERLRRVSGITGYRESNQKPCLRDLRATFAVHRITSWIKRKKNLDLMLPALNAYMGNTGLESTERYLELTPERFRSPLNKLSPQSARSLWREDLSLLEFLVNL